ncbi:protoporphyrinogen oxidase [Fluoribacter dumoffii]|uniref:Protoporphyrinogen oxidase n=1 Tax=Fluoribacter dumoffii TaxID=463 RepID=A0A377GBM2_9GAMM|nr:flavin containing amine oxidoreductase [Fluoribacter dumoffii NY 23]STO22134.1 protoporphyrinogen oxidase [Fluoribacter dumoffii]
MIIEKDTFLKKRIAVIGSGISGLVSCYLLSKDHDVSLFEANDYLGGHTHTIPVVMEGNLYEIDTGFIVFNKKTYPNFCKLLEELNVEIQPSEMSFSYRSDYMGLEYSGHNLNTLFSERRNLFKFDFYRLIKDILSFNHDAKKFLTRNHDLEITINDFLTENKYSKQFRESYLIPMLAAIWSKNKEDTLNCSAVFILKFYENHGLLDVFNRPLWYVIKGGSKNYIDPMIQKFKDQIYLNAKVEKIKRENNKITILTNSTEHVFDAVICATHSDQALMMLEKPTPEEINVLSLIKYTENEVILHRDRSVMPKRTRAWASWNYLDNESTAPTLTYYMNRLQSIHSKHDFFVSVNLAGGIAENQIIQAFKYAHPCLTVNALKAQKQMNLINGVNSTYFVGSYWGYGFHEDGVNSAIHTCKLIGK